MDTNSIEQDIRANLNGGSKSEREKVAASRVVSRLTAVETPAALRIV